MKINRRWRFAVLPVLVVSGLVFAQASQPIAPDKMDIRFVSKQMNVPVEGKFRKFKGNIAWDTAKPEAAKAQIEVDLNSIDMGFEEAETEVKRPLWFNTAKFPTATFVSGSVKPLGGGRYEVGGKLTIKGITRDVTTPVTVTPRTGGGHDVAGALAINRLDYKIGEGEWSETETVANEVQIKFKISLAAAASK
ncbi:MAG: YceI family protein [Burkholderiales bacterium]|nr:YceI family protein [Burkholderiales bacterium]